MGRHRGCSWPNHFILGPSFLLCERVIWNYVAPEEQCCFSFPLLHDVLYDLSGIGYTLLRLFYPKENDTLSCTEYGFFGFPRCPLSVGNGCVFLSLAHHMLVLLTS